MRGIDLEPFHDEHLDGAAALLSARHRRHRDAEPLLPAIDDFRAQVERDWAREGASGAVALRGGEVVGYVIGDPRQFGHAGDTWVVVDLAGHALAEDAELVRDLYAVAAQRWADEGHTRFAAFVPAAERELIDAWFRLSFGASAVLAVRETGPEPAFEPAFDAGVAIRPGTHDDLEAAARLERELRASMVPSPSFSDSPPLSDEDSVEDWRGTWDEEEYAHFVAERGGAVVGHILLYRRPEGDLRIPEASIDLANASTQPDFRGSGVGRALTAHVLTWADEHGYRSMTTDWRITNMLASRFWPKRGFRPTFLRLYRRVP